MTKKEYAELLKSVIRMQIGYIDDGKELDDYHDGIVRGLEVAIEKIDASLFLVEGDE